MSTGHTERAAPNGPPEERHPSLVRAADCPPGAHPIYLLHLCLWYGSYPQPRARPQEPALLRQLQPHPARAAGAKLRYCLFALEEDDVEALLRGGVSDEEIAGQIRRQP